MPDFSLGSSPHLRLFLFVARATLEILIPDFVKQTSEEKPKDSEELEVSAVILFCWEHSCHTVTDPIALTGIVHRVKGVVCKRILLVFVKAEGKVF